MLESRRVHHSFCKSLHKNYNCRSDSISLPDCAGSQQPSSVGSWGGDAAGELGSLAGLSRGIPFTASLTSAARVVCDRKSN